MDDQEQFELGATKFASAQNCPMSAGWTWLSEGFAIFKKSPGLWVLLILITIVLGSICRMIPVVGEVLSMLISPVLLGGIMMVAHRCYMGVDAEFDDLFSGFRHRLWPLIQVALLYLTGMLITLVFAVSVIIVLMGLESVQIIVDLIRQNTLQTANPDIIENFMIMLALILTMMLPLVMMYYFAPVLVMFHGVSAFTAMKLSFIACWKNSLPFLVYGLLIIAFCALSVVTLFLGLLVVIPVIWASTYIAYRDIFLSKEEVLAA